jgi:polygalacturonase
MTEATYQNAGMRSGTQKAMPRIAMRKKVRTEGPKVKNERRDWLVTSPMAGAVNAFRTGGACGYGLGFVLQRCRRAHNCCVSAALMETVTGALYEARRRTAEPTGNLRESAHARREIYRATRSRDRARARELMIQHLGRAEAAQFAESSAGISDGRPRPHAVSLPRGPKRAVQDGRKSAAHKRAESDTVYPGGTLRTIGKGWLVLMIPVVFGFAAAAQDTRKVTEPAIPPACVTLKAALSAPHGVLSDDDERRLDSERIQQAIDGCSPGRAVVLRSDGDRNVFLTGPLTLKSGVSLVVAGGTVLAASRNPRVFDITPGSCGVVNERGHGCKGLITANKTSGSGIMGDGSIDGRGGAKLLGQQVTWWDLAHEAKVTDKQQSVPWMLMVRDSENFTLYRITLRNSAGFHVSVNGTDGFTAWGVKIMTPRTARNTDGIDPGSSRNVTITHCFIHAGDDNVAVKSGKSGPASHISVVHNHFYTGHGMSIGSGTDGGVDHLLVDDLTIDGADNGIRIKSDRSRGGLVQDAVYRNVCIRDTKNPIVMTPMYTTFSGDRLPVYRKITLEDVHILSPGDYTFLGLDAQHMLEVTLDNVFADGMERSTMQAANAQIHIGPGKGNLLPKGDNVTVDTMPNAQPGTPLACVDRFVPFPSLDSAPELAGTVEPEDRTLYVAADGTGDFYSIQRALDVAPDSGVLVLVAPGTYHEVLTVSKPNITLRSADSDAGKTVVVMGKSAGDSGGTLHSATVNVTGNNFVAENITFRNDFNVTHPQLPAGSQALALLVTADRAVFHNVRLLGNQDTLFTGSKQCSGQSGSRTCVPARQYFSDCYIEGNVDFIFGDGKTLFDRCEIKSTPHSEGFITAQGKSYPAEDSGYVFHDCRLTADAGVDNVYLGRPWRPWASVVYLDTEMGAHIQPAGFREWHPGETHSLETAFYAERGSTGPGTDPKQRDPHDKPLSADEARMFQPSTFLRGSDGWNPVKQENQ